MGSWEKGRDGARRSLIKEPLIKKKRKKSMYEKV
jgi:hypothetical protein